MDDENVDVDRHQTNAHSVSAPRYSRHLRRKNPRPQCAGVQTKTSSAERPTRQVRRENGPPPSPTPARGSRKRATISPPHPEPTTLDPGGRAMVSCPFTADRRNAYQRRSRRPVISVPPSTTSRRRSVGSRCRTARTYWCPRARGSTRATRTTLQGQALTTRSTRWAT